MKPAAIPQLPDQDDALIAEFKRITGNTSVFQFIPWFRGVWSAARYDSGPQVWDYMTKAQQRAALLFRLGGRPTFQKLRLVK
jgi:hypothetical protein